MGSWNEVLSGAEDALNSTGGASERMAIYTESLEGKLKTLQSTWEEFVLNLQASDAFKSLIDLGTKLISVLDLILNKIPILSTLIKGVLIAGAINVLIGTIGNLIKLMSKGGLLGSLINIKTGFSTFNTAMQGGATATQALGSALQTAIPLFGKLGSAAGTFTNMLSLTNDSALALSTAIGEFTGGATLSAGAISAVAGALGPLAIAAAAVAGIGLTVWFNSAEKAAQDAKKSINDFNDAQQDLEKTESKLKQINDKIVEINAKGGLTLTDRQELDNLKEQRAELETVLKLKQQIAAQAAKETVPDIQKAFDKTYGGYQTGEVQDFSGAAVGKLQNAAGGLFGVSGYLGAYKELTKRQEEAANGARELSKEEEDAFATVTQKVQNAQTELSSYRNTLQAIKDSMTDAEWEKSGYAQLLKDIDTELDTINQVVSPEAWQGQKIDELLFSDDSVVADKINNLKQQIQSIQDDESLSPEQAQAKTAELIQAAADEIASNPAVKEALDNIFGAGNWDATNLANTIAENLGISLSDALANTDIDLSKIDFSGLDESVDEAVNSANDKLASLGDVSLDPSNFDGIAQAITTAGDATNGLQGELDNLQGTYDALSTNAENAAKMLDFMTENMDILSGTTVPTAAQMDKLKASAAEIGPVVDTSTGQAYTAMDLLNQTVYNTGATAGEMQTNVQSFMGGVTNAGNNTITTMNAVITAINKVKAALATALNAAAGFVDKVSNVAGSIADNGVLNAAVGAFGGNLDAIKSAANGLGSVADGLRAKATALTDSIKSDTADMIDKTNEYESKITNAGNAAKKAYDKSAASAAKAGKSGSGSAKKQTDATKKLTEALKEEYEAQKAILEAQKKQLQARKEALAQEKSDLADAKDAIQNLVEMTMKMLKQEYQNRVDIIEKQIDALQDDLSNQQDKLEKAYNKQTEALENQLDAFNEKIEAQKEYLKLQKEEQDHADELSEKNQAIADVQAQLEELRYDNSASAQKKRLELLDELNGAQKDLTDYQNQYDYDTKVDGLDKEQSAFQKQIEDEKNAIKDRYDQEKQQIEDTYNAKIDALNKEKDYIQNTLMDEYNLYKEAVALVQEGSQDLFNRLMNWNTVSHCCV